MKLKPRLFPYAFLGGMACLSVVFITGCATPELRKTPYYHTESDPAPASAKERIPLWPLVFYQSPTLEVLWPFFEKSDEFIALRPLGSVYGLNQPRQTYSLLWPLGQFDRGAKENRFFPVFWGKEYVVGFPLYWHFDHPLGPDGGTDGLIPLWWYSSTRQGYSFNVLWPVVNVKDMAGEHGWRVWPLAGSYSRGADNYYRFAAWPLAHQWGSGAAREHGDAVLPLYLRLASPSESMFLSLPYSCYRSLGREWDLVPPLLYRSHDMSGSRTVTPMFSQGESADQRNAWQLLLPVYYSSRHDEQKTFITLLGGMSRDADGMGWVVAPLISGGMKTRESSSAWLLGPFAHFGTGLGTSSSHVFPLFCSSASPSGHTFLSLPWSSGSAGDGSEWQLIPPLMLRSSDGKDQRLLTPIYSAGTRRDGAESWQTVFPLWYRSQDAERHTVATLLGGWETGADGRTWLIWPLLSGGRRTADTWDVWAVAPVFRARRDKDGLSSHLLPLYWWNARDKTLLSPAVSKWENPAAGRTTTVVPPALTLYSSEPKKKDFWTLGGAAHFSWGEESGSSHVLPLYYRDPSEGAFLSIPWSQWVWNRDSTNTLIAPAFSWVTRREGRTDLWAVGPVAHFSWGEKAGASHVLPLFYRNKMDDTFISLPYSHWNNGSEECDLYPPLLAMFTRDGGLKRIDALVGLFSERWGKDASEGYFLPFYYHHNGEKFYSLLFGWNRNADNGFFYPLTPLLGVRTGAHSGGWLFPLWSRDHDPGAGRTTGSFLWGLYSADGRTTESALIPFYGYRNRIAAPESISPGSEFDNYGKTFWSLPAVWYRNTVDVMPVYDNKGKATGRKECSTARSHGFFPFWSYSHQTTPLGEEETDGSFLLFLYDYKRTGKTNQVVSQPQDEQVRRRILWRFYHYERKNADVSVDIFPALTYDETRDGFRRWSFLWRAFRYEQGPEGTKLDLLFVPILRSAPAK